MLLSYHSVSRYTNYLHLQHQFYETINGVCTLSLDSLCLFTICEKYTYKDIKHCVCYTLYPAYSQVDSGNQVLRHTVFSGIFRLYKI